MISGAVENKVTFVIVSFIFSLALISFMHSRYEEKTKALYAENKENLLKRAIPPIYIFFILIVIIIEGIQIRLGLFW